jgi:Tfp pilus assembly protein PilO
MIYRRQRQQYIFAGLLAIIAVVNVLFFFILNRPARTEYERLEESIRQLRAQTGTNKVFLDRLEKTSVQLDRFDKDKNALLMKHLIHRTSGYSQIVSTLESLVQRSGVKSTRISYSPDPVPHAGLNTLAVTIPLEGSYGNIVNFIRSVENSETFFLITAINLTGNNVAAGPTTSNTNSTTSGNVTLALALETYFYQ